MSNTPTKLDQLLENLYNSAWVEGNEYDDTREQEGMDTEVRSSRELRRCNTAKAALSAIINQIIGENEIALSPNGAHVKEGKLARNSLRTKQRQRAERMGFIVNKES